MTNVARVCRWLDAKPAWGGNLWTDEVNLHSYAMVIGVHQDGWKSVVIVRRGPSVTTQKHINMAHAMARNRGFSVLRVDSLQRRNRYG